jgi:hypothetical protein
VTTRALEHGAASRRDPPPGTGGNAARAAPAASPDFATRTFVYERASVLVLRLCAAVEAVLAAFFALAPSFAPPADAGGHGPWPFACVVVLAGGSVLTVHCARRMERYCLTVGPQGFHEAPRHDPGTWIAWPRVAQFALRPSGPRFELRDAHGEVLGTLEWGVLDFEQAFEAMLARVPRRPAPLPATYAWNTTWLLLIAVAAGTFAFVGYGLDRWLRHGDPAGLVVAGTFVLFAVGSLLAVRWRTEIHHDRVVVHRGLARREVRWTDVTAVTLSQSRSFDVALRLTNYCAVHIRPTDGDLIGVLVTARAAHAAHVARTAALSAAAPPPPAAAARTP